MTQRGGRARAAVAPLVTIFGAAAFAAVFYGHLASVVPSRYLDRDDAVITLSHARNLVEYGFVGTSPSGERIEGFSAPLQFAVAAAAYAVHPFGYSRFLYWQTLAGTVLLGALFAWLLWSGGSYSRVRFAFVMLATLAAAQILASSSAFLWWHASGMENVYKVSGLLAVLALLDAMQRRHRIWWAGVSVVFLASIARIDAIVPVAVLLGAFVLNWQLRHRDRGAVVFVGACIAAWTLFMIGRWIYFGQWTPNTAMGQGISVSTNLSLLRLPRTAAVLYARWLADAGRALFAFQLAWVIPLTLYLRRDTTAFARAILIGAGAAGCLAQFVLFGPARMDPVRTVTELAVYSVAAAPFVLLAVTDFGVPHGLAGLAIMAMSVALTWNAPPHRNDIGWGTPGFEAVADRLEAMAEAQDLPRPTIANPDLGAVSWRKRFNVIDLGRLGSSVPPRLRGAAGGYLANVALPDLIELHAPWSCEYADLFAAPEFAERYVRLTPLQHGQLPCPGPTGDLPVFWMRRAIMRGSPSIERAFLDRFRATLDPALVEQELARCLPLPASRPCGYLGRTLFRFVPELKQSGAFGRIEKLLARDPRLGFDHALFTSSVDPRWWRIVVPRP